MNSRYGKPYGWKRSPDMRMFAYQTRVLPTLRMFGKIRYKTPWKHFSRQIDEYILYVMKEGEMYLREGEDAYVLKAGDVFLLEPDIIHEGYESASCEYWYAHFKHPSMHIVNKAPQACLKDLMDKRMTCLMSNNLLDELVTDGITYLPKKISCSEGLFTSELGVIEDIYDQRQAFYKEMSSTRFHGFLMLLSHEFLTTHLEDLGFGKIRKSEVVAEQILNHLNHNYMKKISSADLEELFEMNFDHINRVYRKLTGFTIFQHLRTIRMNNAMHLIKTSNLSFSEVGYLVGIEDRYYFSRLFHRHTHMTPTEYYDITHRKKG